MYTVKTKLTRNFNFFLLIIHLELRAQMMSASLLSDMESFKAANPNGKIEDFIRWYSPRDWILNEPGMNIANNFRIKQNDKLRILRWRFE